MALEISYDKYGMTIENCYVIIHNVHYNKGIVTPIPLEYNASYEVQYYASKAARDAEEKSLHHASFQFNVDTAQGADDLLTQAYAHLKTQDEFDGATDV
tara:strand:- start:689 stop:985 length:297 start_codon:yes stop_codon:yes gene_type:complete